MTERAIEFVRATDRFGTEHEFDMNAAALRRIMRRLSRLAKEGYEGEAATAEGVFITVYESRVNREPVDEDDYFSRWTAAQLRDIVQRLQSEHQPESDPMQPGENQTPATTETAG